MKVDTRIFGPLQIAEDSDVTSQFGGDFTHFVSANSVVFGLPEKLSRTTLRRRQ